MRKYFPYTAYILFFCVVFAHFLLAGSSLSGIDAQRFVFVSALFCLCVYTVFKWYGCQGFTVVAAACCVLLVQYSLFEGVNNYYVKQLGYVAMLAALVLFLLSKLDYFSSDDFIFLVGVVSVFALFLVLLCGRAYQALDITFSWKECFAFFSHPRFYNHFQTGTAFLLVYGCLSKGGFSPFRLVSILALPCLFAVAFISAGRGFWLSFFAVSALLALVDRGLFKRVAVVSLASIAVGYCISSVFGGYVSDGGMALSGLSVRGDLSVDNRSRIWGLAWQGALDRPLLGNGAYSYALALPQGVPAHPHQHFLQLAFEYGLAFAVIVYVCLLAAFAAFLRGAQKRGGEFELLLLCSFACLSLNAQYSAVFTMPVGQLVFCVLLAVLIRFNFPHLLSDQPSLPPVVPLAKKVAKALLAFSFIYSGLYWSLVLMDYHGYLSSGVSSLNIIHDGTKHFPRTWQNGS